MSLSLELCVLPAHHLVFNLPVNQEYISRGKFRCEVSLTSVLVWYSRKCRILEVFKWHFMVSPFRPWILLLLYYLPLLLLPTCSCFPLAKSFSTKPNVCNKSTSKICRTFDTFQTRVEIASWWAVSSKEGWMTIVATSLLHPTVQLQCASVYHYTIISFIYLKTRI